MERFNGIPLHLAAEVERAALGARDEYVRDPGRYRGAGTRLLIRLRAESERQRVDENKQRAAERAALADLRRRAEDRGALASLQELAKECERRGSTFGNSYDVVPPPSEIRNERFSYHGITEAEQRALLPLSEIRDEYTKENNRAGLDAFEHVRLHGDLEGSPDPMPISDQVLLAEELDERIESMDTNSLSTGLALAGARDGALTRAEETIVLGLLCFIEAVTSVDLGVGELAIEHKGECFWDVLTPSRSGPIPDLGRETLWEVIVRSGMAGEASQARVARFVIMIDKALASIAAARAAELPPTPTEQSTAIDELSDAEQDRHMLAAVRRVLGCNVRPFGATELVAALRGAGFPIRSDDPRPGWARDSVTRLRGEKLFVAAGNKNGLSRNGSTAADQAYSEIWRHDAND